MTWYNTRKKHFEMRFRRCKQ